MGRTMNSIRMEVREIAERWIKTKKALKKEDQRYAELLASMAKKHSSEAFYLFSDPLEAAVFSVFIEILKLLEDKNDPGLLCWEEDKAVGEGEREGKEARI